MNDRDVTVCHQCRTPLLLKDRYRAIQVIGKGGFGRTFLAIDEQKIHKPRCAIKQFFPQQQGVHHLTKAKVLFRREAAHLAELGRHPQIPELLNYIEQGEYQYVVQDYIEGCSLTQELAQSGAFNELQIRQLLSDLLPVLAFIHQHRVIHRDLKPDNLIRPPYGKLVLVDFGAAKVATGTALAHTGTMIGSAHFAAPEQTAGKAVFASDLYSLGLTCIYLMTNISPFQLFDMAEGTWVWRDYLTQPLSQPLGKILDKLIVQAINYRYQSAAEVLNDLHSNCVSSVALGVVQSSSPNSARLMQQPPTSLRQKQPAQPRQQKTLKQLKCLSIIEAHTKAVHAVALSADDELLASAGEDGRVKLWRMSNGDLIRTLTKDVDYSGSYDALAFSPDGQWLATSGWDGVIRLWQTTNHRLNRRLRGHSGLVSTLAFSPQGDGLASAGYDGTLRLWAMKGNQRLLWMQLLNCQSMHILRESHSGWICEVAFSPDGRRLASVGWDGTVKIWHVQRGTLLQTLTGHEGQTVSVAFSPEGDWLASSGSQDKTVKLWDIKQGQLVHTLPVASGFSHSLAFRPQGQVLASGHSNCNIKLWRVSDGKALGSLTGHSDVVHTITFSSNGRKLISGSADKTIRIWLVR